MLTPAEGWIWSRRNDLVFFFGAALLSIILALLMLISPALVVPFWWLWLWLGDGPHLWATYTRTYLDPEQRRLHSRLFWMSLLISSSKPTARLMRSPGKK